MKKLASILALLLSLAPFAAPLPLAEAATIKAVPTKGLTGYWSFNEGTSTIAHDFSGSKNTGTLTAAVAALPTWTAGKLSQALNFDGASGYVSVPNGGPLNNLQSGSISLWVKYNNTTQPNVVNLVYGTLLVRQHDGVFTNQWLGLDGADPTAAHIRWCPYAATGVAACATGSTVIGANAWQNIVVVYSNGSQTVYVNGVLDASASLTGTMGNDSTALDIGGMYSTGFKSGIIGAIDDVRVYNRTLSASEVQAIYQNGQQNGFTKVNAPFNFITNSLISDWTFNGNDMNWTTGQALDRIGGNNGSLVNMSTTTNPRPGKLAQGLFFDGASNYVSVPNSASLQPLTGDWSVSFWINPKSYGTGDFPQIIGSRPWTAGLDKGWAITLANVSSANAKKISMHFADGTTGFDVNTSAASACASTVPLNTWTHWVVVFDRTNGKLNCYMNGALDAQQSPTFPTGSINQTDALNMGREIGGVNNRKLNAVLDDVRIYNRALSAAEAKQVYSYGATTQNASTNTRSTSGLVGLWSFDGKDMNWATGTAFDRSGSGNNGTLVGLGTTTAPTPGRIGQALKFSGSSQEVSLTALTNLSFSSGTVSWWMKPSSAFNSGVQRGIWGQTSGGSVPEFSCQVLSSDNRWYCGWNSGGAGDTRVIVPASASNYPLNTWAYYTLVWTPSGTTLYQNGTVLGTNNTAPSVSNIANAFHIARQGGTFISYFAGALDDFRIYNRALSAAEIKQLYSQGK